MSTLEHAIENCKPFVKNNYDREGWLKYKDPNLEYISATAEEVWEFCIILDYEVEKAKEDTKEIYGYDI